MIRQEYIDQAAQFMQHESRFNLNFYPCLEDDANHGFDEHYIYHVAWALRKIKEIISTLNVVTNYVEISLKPIEIFWIINDVV
jgi:hypothetical protein